MSRHHRYNGVAKGAEWERLRQQVKDRDDHRCQRCGGAGRLEIHHVIELVHGGTNDLDNLSALCRLCHIDKHRPERPNNDEWMALVRELRIEGA